MIAADYYFRMGSTHSVCQDYAVAGVIGQDGYAILSDGCSGVPNPGVPGSPFTDFGSRFLVRSTLRYIEEIKAGSIPVVKIVADALSIARQASLPSVALDATLIAAIQKGPCVRVYQMGDGVIVARRRTGEITYYTCHYGSNAPYYPRYVLDPGLESRYIQEAKTVTKITRYYNGQWVSPIFNEYILDSTHSVQEFEFSTVDYDLIMIMSDGAESFHKGNEHISLDKVLDEIMTFKSFSGEFLTRRCNAFLKKTCGERGWNHLDDLSVAGIYLE